MPPPDLSSLRSSAAALTFLATQDLEQLWANVNTAEQAREALKDELPTLVATYGVAAAAVAADWYDDTREAEEIRGRFHAVPADIHDSATEALAVWGTKPLATLATVTPVTRDVVEGQPLAFRPSRSPSLEAPKEAAAKLVAGGVQRRITNYMRQTVSTSATADPQAEGWQRIARPGACSFCTMVSARAELYRTEQTARFGAHDHCYCMASPAWKHRPLPVRQHAPSDRDVTDADRARTRQWLNEL